MPKVDKSDDDEELVSTLQAAHLLNLHVRSIHRLVESGRLMPAAKVPGKTGAYLFHRRDVEALTDRAAS